MTILVFHTTPTRGAHAEHPVDSNRTGHIPHLRKWIVVRISPTLILHAFRQVVRNLLTVHFTNPGKRHIDTGSDAAGRKDITILDPPRRGNPGYVGPYGSRPCPSMLVGCCAFAIEDAGAREDRGACAN